MTAYLPAGVDSRDVKIREVKDIDEDKALDNKKDRLLTPVIDIDVPASQRKPRKPFKLCFKIDGDKFPVSKPAKRPDGGCTKVFSFIFADIKEFGSLQTKTQRNRRTRKRHVLHFNEAAKTARRATDSSNAWTAS